jgi:hypothetical protein
LLWQLGRIDDLDGQRDAWVQRCKHLSETLTPQMLLDASLRVSPEQGRRRDPECIKFEQSVLDALTKEGTWEW